jgi:heparosan-N-sulfate-glucuronate 5-epimerase
MWRARSGRPIVARRPGAPVVSTSRWQARDRRLLLGTLALGGSLLLFFTTVGCSGGGGQPAPICRTFSPTSSALPPPYPLANSNLEKFADFPRDADGVVYDPRYGGYHPTLVAGYALALYAHFYETGDAGSLADFLTQARWLRDRFVKLGDFGAWQFGFDYEPFEASAPWVSALMQGWGLTVMLQAAALDAQQPDAYESVANLALQAFQVPVSDGGVRSTWDDGTVWYEEYATVLNSHVLNGFIFALAGVYWHWQQTGDQGAEALFTQGVDALKQKVTEYDKGFASAVDAHYHGNAPGRGG